MGRCLRCGQDAWPYFKYCGKCRKAWREGRDAAFNKATEELGPLNADNHKAFARRVLELEHQAGAKEVP